MKIKGNSNLRGKRVTWLISHHNYHWVRIGRIIVRWQHNKIKIQYLGKKNGSSG